MNESSCKLINISLCLCVITAKMTFVWNPNEYFKRDYASFEDEQQNTYFTDYFSGIINIISDARSICSESNKIVKIVQTNIALQH